MDKKLLDFLLRLLGRPGVGTNAVNRGQCVGLVEVWLAELGLPFVGGNAKDLPANAPPTRYLVVRNGPSNYPPPGAVVCWGASWGGGYGHTAVVVAANGMYLAVFEQNDPSGSPPLVATHSYEGVEAWFSGK